MFFKPSPPPLFKPSDSFLKGSDGYANDTAVEWPAYLDKYQTRIEPPLIASVELFKHNIKNQPQLLDYHQVDMWRKIVIYMQARGHTTGTEPFLGEALRLIYDASDKSEQIKELIHTNLARCNIENSKQFICLNKTNHNILNDFFNSPLEKIYSRVFDLSIIEASCDKLMFIYKQTSIKKQIFNSDSIYLAQHIYTPKFIENLNTNTEDIMRSCQTGAILNIIENIESFIPALSSIPNKQLEHLVSILYSSEILIDNNFLMNPITNARLPDYFKETFPSEYEQYQTLKSLGITPKPSEFLMQLNSQYTNTVELPELN